MAQTAMTPPPLMALVREWPHSFGCKVELRPEGEYRTVGEGDFCKRCTLEAALKAWAERLKRGDWRQEWNDTIAERVLGVEEK